MTLTSNFLEKLKLRTLKYFVENLTGNMKELEKVFLPTRFWANASKHISILLWNRLIFKGQSKIEKSLLPSAQEVHRDSLTILGNCRNVKKAETLVICKHWQQFKKDKYGLLNITTA